MDKKEKANKTIEQMNRLWKMLNASATAEVEQNIRNKFVECQQWLSNHKFQYYQEEHTGEWKLR